MKQNIVYLFAFSLISHPAPQPQTLGAESCEGRGDTSVLFIVLCHVHISVHGTREAQNICQT